MLLTEHNKTYFVLHRGSFFGCLNVKVVNHRHHFKLSFQTRQYTHTTTLTRNTSLKEISRASSSFPSPAVDFKCSVCRDDCHVECGETYRLVLLLLHCMVIITYSPCAFFFGLSLVNQEFTLLLLALSTNPAVSFSCKVLLFLPFPKPK